MQEVRGNDDHILASLTRPAGLFEPGFWNVSELSADFWLNALASFHEAQHARANGVTTWGALLQALSIATRSGPSPDRHRQVLNALVDRCRRTHEAFATHEGIINVVGRKSSPTIEAIHAAYPEYAAHLAEALALGPPEPLNRKWRQLACESALLVCMRADVVAPLLNCGLAQFTLSRLSDLDTPDTRLSLLRRSGSELWEKVDRRASDAYGDRWPRLRSMSSRDAAAAEYGEVWQELESLCMDAAAQVLAAKGLRTVGADDVPDMQRAVMDATAQWIGGQRGAITLDTDPSSMFDMERLTLRRPRPARVRDLASCRGEDLVSGSGPGWHVFLTVRTPEMFRRQFVLHNDPWPAQYTEPVVAVQTQRPDGTIDIHPVESPSALASMAWPDTELGLLAAVALTCARDEGWADVWQDPLFESARVAIVLDLPLSESIAALLASGGDFRYALVDFMDESRYLCAFVCTDGEHAPDLVLCTPTAGIAFVEHVTRKTGGSSPVDLAALTPDTDAVMAIITHLASDDSIAGASI